MRKLFIVVFILFATCIHGQTLSQVSFLDGANLSFFSISSDYNILIRVSVDGKLLEWGTEVKSDRYSFYASKLQPFMGRMEYYGPESDSAYRGKIKSIGTCFITYYASYDNPNKTGKVKTMGPLLFDYYEAYEDKKMQGKLKQVGNLSIEYYREYEDESVRGKLKSIGSMPIVYYTVFDDKVNAGKLKSIGPVIYYWYSLSDPVYMRGTLKGDAYRRVIAGINFILR